MDPIPLEQGPLDGILQILHSVNPSASLSQSIYIQIQTLCNLEHYVQANRAIDEWSSASSGNSFVEAFCKSVICNRRGDFYQSKEYLSQEFSNIHPLDSRLLRLAICIFDLRVNRTVRGTMELVQHISDGLLKDLEDSAVREPSASILGVYTALEIYRLITMARIIARNLAEPNQPDMPSIIKDLERISTEYLRIDAHSLAFMTYSEQAKLQQDPADKMRMHALAARERGHEVEHVRLLVMALSTEVEAAKFPKADDPIYLHLESECNRVGWDGGVIEVRALKDAAKYEGLFGNSSIEAEFVGCMQEHRAAYQARGDFLGEWTAMMLIIERIPKFIDTILVQQCRREALELIARWGYPSAGFTLRLNFSSWFLLHGHRASAYEHAKFVYDHTPCCNLLQTSAATLLAIMATEGERFGWAMKAYNTSKDLEEGHTLRQEATRTLAMLSDFQNAFDLLRPYINQYLEKGDMDGVMRMLQVLDSVAVGEERRGNQGPSNNMLRFISKLITKVRDDQSNAALVLMQRTICGRLHVCKGEYEEAIKSWHIGINAAEKLLPQSTTVPTRFGLAGVYGMRGRLEESQQELEGCLAVARRAGMESMIFECCNALTSASIRRLRKAVKATPEVSIDFDRSLVLDMITEALRYAAEAEASLDSMRRDFNTLTPGDALVAKGELVLQTDKLYREIIPLVHDFRSSPELWCWVQASKSRNFLEVAAVIKYHHQDRTRNAESIDHMQAWDWQDHLRSARAPLVDSREVLTAAAALSRYQEVLADLPDGAAVVEWITIHDCLYLMICNYTANQPFLISLNKDYSSEVHKMREIGQSEAWYAEGANLLDHFAYLIQPLQDHTEPNQHLILIPTKEIYRIPLHALRLKEQYLLERNPVSYSLSLLSLVGLRATQARLEDEATSNELLIAFPAGRCFDPDPVEQERCEQAFRELHQEQSPSTLLLGAHATVQRCLQAMPKADLIYCLSHAEPTMDRLDPLSAAFLMADNGLLTARRVTELQLRATTTILAGCRSLQGQNSSTDDYLGFINSFILAGSQSVLGTLHKVLQEDTVPISTSLLRKIRLSRGLEAKSMAELVRETVTEYMKEPGRAEPKHWASFALYGDGSVTFGRIRGRT
ncbi:hypothetical protein BT69DRAFT_1339672 [Atractiella rhizophila]|nr:hypothetical protein BT69DRAFT_1339672 [Atractiella rhizophila]